VFIVAAVMNVIAALTALIILKPLRDAHHAASGRSVGAEVHA
jgi:hypothetical protein